MKGLREGKDVGTICKTRKRRKGNSNTKGKSKQTNQLAIKKKKKKGGKKKTSIYKSTRSSIPRVLGRESFQGHWVYHSSSPQLFCGGTLPSILFFLFYFLIKERPETVFLSLVFVCGFARFSTFNMSLVVFLILEWRYALEHFKW